jgi:hypothetical protein
VKTEKVQEYSQPSEAASSIITTFDDYQFHENRQRKSCQTRKSLVWQLFAVDTEQTFDFSFPNLVTSTLLNTKFTWQLFL